MESECYGIAMIGGGGRRGCRVINEGSMNTKIDSMEYFFAFINDH